MKVPSGKRDVDVLEVVLAGALDDQRCGRLAAWQPSARPRRRARRFVGTGIAFLPRQVLAGQRRLRPQHLLRRALGGDLAAAVAGAGAEVEQVVGRGDHLAVVLDQDQRVAQVAQVLQAPAAAGGCRAGAGRWSARRGRRARRSGRCRSGWPGGCAATRRRTASAPAGSASGSRGRRRPGTAGGCVISRSSSPATCCCCLGQLQLLEEVAASGRAAGRTSCAERVVLRSGTAAASSRSREPPQVGAGHLADQVIELLPVDEADARRLVDGGEEALVLEA